ncbi:MAG: TrkA family potassium uptake protein [Actinomycetota bacterium]|nr:TrkA family potassium uptake protein [Actinomycetota bacterium]
MGCGRVGSTLATSLEESGHSVAVVDQSPEAFRRLPADFAGRKVTGLGFDRDTLVQAGIEDAYAFAAVSDGDNSNILAARVVRETYGVDHVVARIYDPGRAEIYQRLGIPTVATVRWTADQVLRRLLPMGATQEYLDPSGQVALVRADSHSTWVGSTLAEIELATGSRVAFVTRGGVAQLPGESSVLQDGDELCLAVATERVGKVERLLATKKEA